MQTKLIILIGLLGFIAISSCRDRSKQGSRDDSGVKGGFYRDPNVNDNDLGIDDYGHYAIIGDMPQMVHTVESKTIKTYAPGTKFIFVECSSAQGLKTITAEWQRFDSGLGDSKKRYDHIYNLLSDKDFSLSGDCGFTYNGMFGMEVVNLLGFKLGGSFYNNYFLIEVLANFLAQYQDLIGTTMTCAGGAFVLYKLAKSGRIPGLSNIAGKVTNQVAASKAAKTTAEAALNTVKKDPNLIKNGLKIFDSAKKAIMSTGTRRSGALATFCGAVGTSTAANEMRWVTDLNRLYTRAQIEQFQKVTEELIYGEELIPLPKERDFDAYRTEVLRLLRETITEIEGKADSEVRRTR